MEPPTAEAQIVLSLLDKAKRNEWDPVEAELHNLFRGLQSNDTDERERAHKLRSNLGSVQDWETGNTLSHIAAAADRLSVVKLLYACEVDLRKSNFATRSPLEEARKACASLVLQFIIEHVYSPVEALFYSRDDFDALVETFTRHPESINEPLVCYNGMTWIALCTEEARLRELRWLVEHGADTTVVDEGGNTLLHLLEIPFSLNEDSLSIDSSSLDEAGSELSFGSPRSASSSPSVAQGVGRLGDTVVTAGSGSTSVSIDISSQLTQKQLKDDPDLTEAEKELLEVIGNGISQLNEEELRVVRTAVFLLSLKTIPLTHRNHSGSTAAHCVAEKGSNNPQVSWMLLKLLLHCGADLNLQDNEGANVGHVLAENCGDGPWLTWILSPVASGGGECHTDRCDAKGRKVEDLIVTAHLEAFDSELDLNEAASASTSSSSSSSSPPSSEASAFDAEATSTAQASPSSQACNIDDF